MEELICREERKGAEAEAQNGSASGGGGQAEEPQPAEEEEEEQVRRKGSGKWNGEVDRLGKAGQKLVRKFIVARKPQPELVSVKFPGTVIRYLRLLLYVGVKK